MPKDPPKTDHYDFVGSKPAIRRGDDNGDERMAKQGRTWAVGADFAFTVMGGGLIGWLIQTYAYPASKPWALLGGLGAGLLVGMVQFIREAMKLNKGG